MPSACSASTTSPAAYAGKTTRQAVAGLTVPDQVREVAHLRRDTVTFGEVTAGEQLAEVQPVGVGHSLSLWPRPPVHRRGVIARLRMTHPTLGESGWLVCVWGPPGAGCT